MQATALPVLVIAVGIVGSYYTAGEALYGIGVAVMAQLSMTGLIVALDAYGPVTDNAGGIAEMADLPPEVRRTSTMRVPAPFLTRSATWARAWSAVLGPIAATRR